jgi:hypothetical protein
VTIHVSEILPALDGAHVKINSRFLRQICKCASKNSKPSKDDVFVNKLGLKINPAVKLCTTIEGWLRGYRTVPTSKLVLLIRIAGVSWSDIEQKIISIKAGPRRGEIRPSFPIKIDERLGRIVGHILGDGAIDSRYTQVFFSNKNHELLREFIEDMHSVFGAEPRIWEHHAESSYDNSKWGRRLMTLDEKHPDRCVGLFYPTICGRMLLSIFGKFALGRNKEITAEILGAPRPFKRGLLRALFDDEGSCSSSSYVIRLHQDDARLLEKVRAILADFGISSNEVRTYYRHRRPQHYFSITGKPNFVAFLNNIGFTSSKKRFRLALLARPDQRRFVTPRRLQYL